jgi:hypothetical protein
MSTRLDKATKAFERGMTTTFAGEREACRRASLRLIASELGIAFDPATRIDPVKEWGLKVERQEIFMPTA